MGIGQFNKRLTVVTIASNPDGYGGRTEEGLQTVITVWGRVSNSELQSGNIRNEIAGQVNWDKSYKIDLRYDGNYSIGKATYIVYDNKIGTIQAVKRVNERKFYWQVDVIINEIDTGTTGAATLPTFDGINTSTYHVDGTEAGTYYLKDNDGNIVTDATILIFSRSTFVLEVISTGSPTGNQVKYNSSTGELIFGTTPVNLNETFIVIWVS